jgi:ornithine cyclodeaminase
MLIVSEQTCMEVVSHADASTAVENVFAAMARGDAYILPAIRQAIGHADAFYGALMGWTPRLRCPAFCI